MMRRRNCWFSLFFLSFLVATVVAQEGPSSPRNLAAEAREAGKNYRAVASGDVAAARTEAAKAARDLDAFFRTGAAYKSVGWKKYLQWDNLETQLKSDQPAADSLNATLAKLRANQSGLERAEFTRLRDALAAFATASGAAANSKLQEDYPKRMEELAANLEAYAKDRSAGEAALAIGRTLGWLENNRQAPELVSSIRRTYGRPNFLGHASQRFVAAGIERDVDRVSAISDNILGTSLHGTARTVGRTTLSLVENPRAASMNILLGGTAWSNNVGYNGPVTIFSTGVTSVSGRKSIYMDAEGMHAYGAQASCGTRSNINDICAKCGLIEKIAWKRAGQQKGQAEAIASQHASWRVAAQMDSESAKLLKEQNDRYLDKFRNPLLRKGEFPEELTFSTTRDRVQVRMLQESTALLGAPDEPPGFSSDHDLAARVHESAVINYGQVALPDYYLSDLEVVRIYRDELKREVPEELQISEDKEPWAIRFANDLPALVKFRDGGVWMAIRTEGVYRGETSPGGPYRLISSELTEISANYTIEKTQAGATLKRMGDVVIRFPSRANPEQRLVSRGDFAVATLLSKKFGAMFKEEFVGEGLKMQGEWARAGTLKLQDIRSEGAWLRVGWEMAADVSQRDSSTGVGAAE